MVIAADQDTQSLTNAWFYVPRMLHESSLVLLEDTSGSQQPLPQADVRTSGEVSHIKC